MSISSQRADVARRTASARRAAGRAISAASSSQASSLRLAITTSAPAGEAARHRAPEPAAAAGDEGDLAGQVEPVQNAAAAGESARSAGRPPPSRSGRADAAAPVGGPSSVYPLAHQPGVDQQLECPSYLPDDQQRLLARPSRRRPQVAGDRERSGRDRGEHSTIRSQRRPCSPAAPRRAPRASPPAVPGESRARGSAAVSAEAREIAQARARTPPVRLGRRELRVRGDPPEQVVADERKPRAASTNSASLAL